MITRPDLLHSRRSTLRFGLAFAVANFAPARAAYAAQDYIVSDPVEDRVREAIASGAARVVLPPGRIVLGRTLHIPSGMTLVGAGPRRTLFVASGRMRQEHAMIEGAGRGIVLADFALDGGAGAGHGVQLTGFGHRLAGLNVRDVAQAGYRLSVSGSAIEDCVAIDCGRSGHTDNHGFMLYTTAREGLSPLRATTFRRCRVDHAFRKGFALYSDGPEISEIAFEECSARRSGLAQKSGGGFYLVPAGSGRVADVTVRACLAEDNYVNYELGPVSNLLVTRCQSRNAEATGYLIHGSRNVEIVHNTDDGSGVDALRFDNVGGPSVAGRVANNVLTNANRSARGFASYINLEGAEQMTVADNVVGDQDGRSSHSIYEGASAGKNDIRANRQIERLSAGAVSR